MQTIFLSEKKHEKFVNANLLPGFLGGGRERFFIINAHAFLYFSDIAQIVSEDTQVYRKQNSCTRTSQQPQGKSHLL